MNRQLYSNSEEETYVRTDLEQLIIKRRGFLFKKPSSTQGIVFIVSGGLDSTITLFRSLKELDCIIYPLYVRRGARSEKSELESLHYYLGLFRLQFKKKLKQLEIIESEVPPKHLKQHYPKAHLSKIGHPMRNAILQSYAIQYALAISYRDKIKVETVFTAISPDDTLPHCSLQALRAETVLACIDAGNWGWHITSPLLEPDLWGTIHKTDSIKYAMENELNLDHTYTCTQMPDTACGTCPECHLRLEAFAKSGYNDPIKYKQAL